MYDDIAYGKDDIWKRESTCEEYAICMTTLCIVKTILGTRSVHVLEPAICMTTSRIARTTFIHMVQMFWNA